jgi:hypothetical protein
MSIPEYTQRVCKPGDRFPVRTSRRTSSDYCPIFPLAQFNIANLQTTPHPSRELGVVASLVEGKGYVYPAHKASGADLFSSSQLRLKSPHEILGYTPLPPQVNSVKSSQPGRKISPISKALQLDVEAMEKSGGKPVKEIKTNVSAKTTSVKTQNARKQDARIIAKTCDKGIESLRENILPEYPHIVKPQLGADVLRYCYPWEYAGLPFSDQELQMGLQYMSNISLPHDRGVTMVHGDWQGEASVSAGSRSGATTPQSERDLNKPRVKLTMKEWAAQKAAATDPEKLAALKIQHEARIEADKKLMMEDLERREKQEKDRKKKLEIEGRKAHDATMRKMFPTKNDSPNQGIRSIRISEPASGDGNKTSSPKRSFEGSDNSEPSKRVKTAPGPTLEKNRNSNSKSLDVKRETKTANEKASSTPKSTSASTSSITKSNQRPVKRAESASKAVDTMPPLLSPLPAGLTSPVEVERPSPAQKLVNGHTSTPSTKRANDAELHGRSNKPNLPPITAPSFFEMPPLLSPTLPPEIEEALQRLHAITKSTKSTVEALHERSRLPDTPGVARKMPKSHIKDRQANALKSQYASKAESDSEKDSKIVRLKYGRRNSKTILRLLSTKQHPSSLNTGATASKAPASSSRSDEKRRARNDDDTATVEPATKRPRAPSTLDVDKSRTSVAPAFKSPNPSTSSMAQKGLLGTPKKGDVMKSVAMQKVASSDGQASTPNSASISTPASAEKPKSRPMDPKLLAEVEALKVAHLKLTSLGTSLKRRMDAILKTKEPQAPPVSEDQQRLGIVTGLESIAAYMKGFDTYDRKTRLEKRQNDGQNWEQLISLLPFIITRAHRYPDLNTAALGAVALTRDVLVQIHSDRLGAESTFHPDAYRKFKESMAYNIRHSKQAWRQYDDQFRESHCKYPHLGPWSTVSDAVALISEILDGFTKKYNVKWEKKVDF